MIIIKIHNENNNNNTFKQLAINGVRPLPWFTYVYQFGYS